MKLSLVDKTLLLRWGYQTADFPQIEAAMQSRNTKYTLDGQTIPGNGNRGSGTQAIPDRHLQKRISRNSGEGNGRWKNRSL